MENLLLEISQRQTDQSVHPAPGDFSVTLAKPIFIYPGDEIAVSKTFMDTQSETDGVITIEPNAGIDVRLDWCVLYITIHQLWLM